MTQIPTWSSGNAAHGSGRAGPGTVIGGRYTLRAAVGHGGMGTVWRAADDLLRRDVAVKEVVLPQGLAPSDRDAMYERTMREARAAAALQHPAVVQVYDVVHENDRPWIVMELLDARSLADMVIEDGPVAPRVVAKIGIALLGALEVAHAHGVLHRDVKPANVLICSDGRCVLTDFGVARMPTDVQLTTPGMVLGSPHFISPERAMGSEFGPPSDLFSLGVTLYTAVEGRPPFDRGDPIETMHAVVEDPPAPTSRAGSLDAVLMGLLQKDPAQRLDVKTARTMLRQQLAGPLASKAPPHLMTDPYAVVPSQRPSEPTRPVSPPAPPQQPAGGQIGGRAMLAPGESLSGHLAKVRQDRRGNHRRPDPSDTGALAQTMAGGQVPPVPSTHTADRTAVIPPGSGGPTGAAPASGAPAGAAPASGAPAGAAPVSGGAVPPGSPAAPNGFAGAPNGFAGAPGGFPYRPGPGGPGDGPTGVLPPGPWNGGGGARAPWDGARAARDPLPGGVVHGGGSGPAAGVRAAADRAVGAVRALPRRVQLAAAGGLAAVLLLVVVVVALAGGDDPAGPPGTAQPPSAAAPAGPATQDHQARGVTVKVPKGWKRTASGNWVDYTDPADPRRKVRLLIEPTSGTSPTRFLTFAEDTLDKRSANCPKSYNRVSLQEATIGGRPGAVLEYTCGSDPQQGRHGMWGVVLTGGKAYSFYLTTQQARFAESKVVFDQMMASYALQGA